MPELEIEYLLDAMERQMEAPDQHLHVCGLAYDPESQAGLFRHYELMCLSRSEASWFRAQLAIHNNIPGILRAHGREVAHA